MQPLRIRFWSIWYRCLGAVWRQRRSTTAGPVQRGASSDGNACGGGSGRQSSSSDQGCASPHLIWLHLPKLWWPKLSPGCIEWSLLDLSRWYSLLRRHPTQFSTPESHMQLAQGSYEQEKPGRSRTKVKKMSKFNKSKKAMSSCVVYLCIYPAVRNDSSHSFRNKWAVQGSYDWQCGHC